MFAPDQSGWSSDYGLHVSDSLPRPVGALDLIRAALISGEVHGEVKRFNCLVVPAQPAEKFAKGEDRLAGVLAVEPHRAAMGGDRLVQLSRSGKRQAEVIVHDGYVGLELLRLAEFGSRRVDLIRCKQREAHVDVSVGVVRAEVARPP